MAEATIYPETGEFVVAGTSRAHSAWLWTRALLHKAQMGFVEGVVRVKVAVANALGSTAAVALAAGTQIALATRAGWNAGTRVLTKVLGGIAKGALLVAKGVSWVADKIGKAVGWFVGLFNKGAGERIKEANARFTEWRTARIEGGKARVNAVQSIGHAAMTTKGVSTVGRIAAGTMGVGTVANLATQGAVAGYASTLPVIGKFAGLAFGPMGLLITGGIALLGGLFSWFFKRDAVAERMEEIVAEEIVKKYGDPANSELVVNLTREDGKTKVRFGGHPLVVKAINEDPALQNDLAEAAFALREEEGKETLAKHRPKGAKAPAAAPA